MNTDRGFAPILIGLILTAILAGGFVAYKISQNQKVKNPDVTEKQNQINDETKDWKTYRNEKYGFEFEYPSEWETKKSQSLPAYTGTDFLKNGVVMMMVHNTLPEIGYEVWKQSEETRIPITNSSKKFYKFTFTPLTSEFDPFVLVSWNVDEGEDWQHSGRIVIPSLKDNDPRLKILNNVLSTFRLTAIPELKVSAETKSVDPKTVVIIWKKYKNESYGFEFEVPSIWYVDDNLNLTSCCLNIRNFTVGSERLFSGQSVMQVKSYSKTASQSLTAFVSSENQQADSSPETVMIAGTSMMKVHARSNEEAYYYEVYYLPKSETGGLKISSWTHLDTIEKLQAIIEKIVSTFKFTK